MLASDGRHRAPAPDPAQRRRRAGSDAREPVRPHPLPALLRPAPAHLAARPGAVHRRRPPRPGGVHLPGRRRDRRRRPVRGPARRRRPRRHHRHARADSAEVAFVARDDHQGRGLGSILLEHLAAAARENGLRRFEAEVLAENHAMVRVFRQAGYQVSRAFEDGVLHLEFDIDPTEQSVAVRDAREQRAEARSVHNLLHPPVGRGDRRVRRPDQDRARGARPTCCAATSPGRCTRSTRTPARCAGCGPTASVTDIPDEVDLAVVAVPAAGHRRGHGLLPGEGRVRRCVVLSAGFADAGADGTVAQRRLVTEARAHGMRVIGPNALGVANTDPAVRLNATLAPELPGAAGSGSSASPAPSASRSWPRPRSAGSACPPSSRPATGPTSPATTCCSTGRPTRPPTWSCSTWRPSATRASSPGWPGGWPGPSRSSR